MARTIVIRGRKPLEEAVIQIEKAREGYRSVGRDIPAELQLAIDQIDEHIDSDGFSSLRFLSLLEKVPVQIKIGIRLLSAKKGD